MRFPFPQNLLCRLWPVSLLLVLVGSPTLHAAHPIPVDPSFWQSTQFRRAFVGSYGVDARIEPRLTTDEKAVLDSVAEAMEDGNRKTAISRLNASSLTSGSAALSFSLGNLQFEEGETEKALEAFEDAVELYPNFRDAHRNLAVALVQDGKFDEAESHLIRAIELGAQDGLSFGLLGYVHLNHERYQAGLQAYRLAQLTMPKETQWKMGEAQCLLALDSVVESAALYRELLEQRPTDLAVWMNQADAFIQLEEPIKAIANLEMTRRMGQLKPAETLMLGHLYLNEMLTSQALTAYLEAIDREEPVEAAKALDALDYVCRLNQWEAAKTLLPVIQSGYELEPESKEELTLQRSQALIEFEVGDAAKGEKLVLDLIDRDPLDGQALLLLARYRESQGNREEAIQLAEHAAKDKETAFDALLFHGQMLVDRGNFEEAVELLDQAISLQPSGSLEAYVENIRQIADLQP